MPLQYPENLEYLKDLKGGTMMSFTLFKRPDSQQSQLEEQIYLYMPETLQNNTNTTWEQSEVGRTARGFRESGLSGLDAGSTASLVADKAKQMVHHGLRMAAGGADRADYATGSTLNPYIAMTFKNLNFRQFEMTFKFTPHTEGESTTIHNIIKKFREASLPSLNGNLFTYPMEFDVEYMGAGEEWLFKYKRCVLLGVDVNYAGAGFYASMENGFPAQTEMTLRFSENQLVSREDIAEGY